MYAQRRRSKQNFVNLSGKKTLTGRSSGECPQGTAKGDSLPYAQLVSSQAKGQGSFYSKELLCPFLCKKRNGKLVSTLYSGRVLDGRVEEDTIV